MDTLPVCQKCGTPLLAVAGQDQCPKCLLAGGLATSTAGDDATTQTQPVSLEGASARIGSYKLLQLIGEGGMGTVWIPPLAICSNKAGVFQQPAG